MLDTKGLSGIEVEFALREARRKKVKNAISGDGVIGWDSRKEEFLIGEVVDLDKLVDYLISLEPTITLQNLDELSVPLNVGKEIDITKYENKKRNKHD